LYENASRVKGIRSARRGRWRRGSWRLAKAAGGGNHRADGDAEFQGSPLWSWGSWGGRGEEEEEFILIIALAVAQGVIVNTNDTTVIAAH
jgi:hypothetical protein